MRLDKTKGNKVVKRKVTAKMEAFCQEYVKCGVLSDSYKAAGYAFENSKPDTLYTSAYKLSRKPQVVNRIKQLQDKLEDKFMKGWKLEDSVRVLSKIAESDSEETKKSDVINAVKELNSMAGYRSDKIDHTSSDGSMSTLEQSKAVIAAIRNKYPSKKKNDS